MQLLLHRHWQVTDQSVVMLHDAGRRIVGNLSEDFRRNAFGVQDVHLATERALDGDIELRGRPKVVDAGHFARHAYLEGGGAALAVDFTGAADDKGPILVIVHSNDSSHSNLRPFKGQ